MVLPQIACQVLALDPASIRCKPRAWKVHLVGEGADDAGGVFDETIAQMCEVCLPLYITIGYCDVLCRRWKVERLIC